MKKLISVILVLVLVVAMAAPAMALTDSMKYSYEHATNGGITANTTTGASLSQSYAHVRASMAARLAISEVTTIRFNGIEYTSGKQDLVTATLLTIYDDDVVYVNNEKKHGDIVSIEVEYTVNRSLMIKDSVS